MTRTEGAIAWRLAEIRPEFAQRLAGDQLVAGVLVVTDIQS
jgi:hypothetical protein